MHCSPEMEYLPQWLLNLGLLLSLNGSLKLTVNTPATQLLLCKLIRHPRPRHPRPRSIMEYGCEVLSHTEVAEMYRRLSKFVSGQPLSTCNAAVCTVIWVEVLQIHNQCCATCHSFSHQH